MVTFTSRPPVEVARLPWLDEVAVQNDAFASMLPPGIYLDRLEHSWLAAGDHLREVAVEVGKIVVAYGFEADSTTVDIRSGLYDPRIGNGFDLGYHFDPRIDQQGPAETLLVVTGKAGNAAVGEIAVEPRPDINPEDENTWLLEQARAGHGRSLFDLSRAKIMPMHPSVLYYLPKRCVHCSPSEFGPYGRNLFRYKRGRAA